MVGGIYKIENIVDGKSYIGSSVNVSARKYKHFWMLKKGVHDNNHLQHSYNKFGEESFKFEILEYCPDYELISRENYHIIKYKSSDSEFGYNLATVNEFRRNTYNDEVKIKLSKYGLTKNGNFTAYSLTNIQTNGEYIFHTLVDGTNYLIKNGFAKGKSRNVRMNISNSLRGVKLNNGHINGSIRKTCYKHKFKIIN
jgi:group I intron endonuclease